MLNWKDKKVMVIGDIMVDKFCYGESTRLSPDAPVPIVDVDNETLCNGGAANVAFNIGLLGGNPVLIGVVGEDWAGESICSAFPNVLVEDCRETLVKYRVFSGEQQVVRIDYGSTWEVEKHIELDLISKIQINSDIDAIIISDYGKGTITNGIIKAINEIRKDKSIPLVIDPKPFNVPKYACSPTVLVPNAAELMAVANTDDIDKAVECLFLITKAENILVTRGDLGSVLFKSPRNRIDIWAKSVKSVFVGGAGDVVAAVMGLGLSVSDDIEHVSRIANIAAGISVQHNETCVCHYEELFEEMKGD